MARAGVHIFRSRNPGPPLNTIIKTCSLPETHCYFHTGGFHFRKANRRSSDLHEARNQKAARDPYALGCPGVHHQEPASDCWFEP